MLWGGGEQRHLSISPGVCLLYNKPTRTNLDRKEKRQKKKKKKKKERKRERREEYLFE